MNLLFTEVVFTVVFRVITSSQYLAPSLKTLAISVSKFKLQGRNKHQASLKIQFEATTKSISACARHCAVDESCNSFLYNPNSDICRLYTAVLQISRLTTPLDGALIYTKGTPKEDHPSGRLLISVETNVPMFLQLHLRNNSLQPYPFIQTKDFIQALAFVKETRQILISTTKSRKIISYLLDDSKHHTVKTVSCYEMAVDQKDKLVFLSLISKSGETIRISKMDTDGSYLYRIYSRSTGYVAALAVIPTIKRLFVGSKDRVYSLTYDGRTSNVVLKLRSVRSLSFDSIENVLYIRDSYTLLKMNISQHQTTTLSHIPATASHIIYHQSRIYSKRRRGVNIWNVLTRDSSEVSTDSFHLRVSAAIICLIP